jgi:outer membrane protein OmpA-like peptidoglycan-associated protein
MRTTIVGLVIAFGSTVADANVEIGGTGGLHVFHVDNELGVDDRPDVTSLKNAPMFGLRLGINGNVIGIEAEGAVVLTKPRREPAFDVYTGAARGHLVLQFRAGTYENTVVPFFLVGGGVMNVVKSDNTAVIAKDTDVMAYAGLGFKFRGNGWGIRFEGRALMVPSTTSTGVVGVLDFEALGSLYIDIGRKKQAAAAVVTNPDEDVPPKTDIVVAPKPEVSDEDKDGVVDTDDKCKDQPEDKDSFEDGDGCPDPDNDNDTVFDADDKCADQPETKNGLTDEDGCPDEMPADLAPFLGPVAGLSFKPNTAAFAGRSTKVLDKLHAALASAGELKLEIRAHTDDSKPKGKFKTNDALSQARAEAVKAYLVKKGIDASRLDAKGYAGTEPIKEPKGLKGAALKAARAKNARIEFKIMP